MSAGEREKVIRRRREKWNCEEGGELHVISDAGVTLQHSGVCKVAR